MAAEAAKPHPPGGTSKLVGPLAIVAYLLSLPVLAFGIWLVSTRDYDCEDLLREPNVRVSVGVGLLLVFAISNFVVYYGDRVLMPGHMVLSVALVVMLTAGLSLVGTYRMEARGLPGSPLWLRNRVMRAETWKEVKTCLYGDMICEDLAYRTIQFTSHDFSLTKLSALESGCCKPPDVCEMEYVNAINWTEVRRNSTRDSESSSSSSSNSATNASHVDCHAWSNQPTILCYDCQSCKAAFLTIITSRWRKVGVFLIVMSTLFLFVHAVRFIILMSARFKP
ncbi:unnamed protein product [Musa hybrid cultivar]